ncbi:NAD(P)-dependent oxidoreductase [Pseudarthrobacter sulfonivorans]|uniref:NAD(P)-dependent oxidoreductase n=1 Tax=Pseudarthrobacter sulfonivorans TaxID=121292 RepID=UPI0028619155|nr:NAD(P)-dependent oxidoreductase [Pseudarthrobacter sulfonivorans]MDR6417507.1 3-hydroxyisobutyrate dehydrogenase [Pseudarthrobacter sulfonivorans]
MSTPQIAFIGAGAIGLPMAVRAAAAGNVTAVDTSPERLAEARKQGLKTAESINSALPADTVLVMVATADQAAAVLNGPEGLYARAGAGSTIVILSTLGPAAMQKLAAERPPAGPMLLDVPVTGGVPGAIAGTLTLFAGGDPEEIERIRPILETMGKVVFAGPNVGDGQAFKMVNQLLATSQLVVAAEALGFAERLGLDTHQVFEAVRGGAGGSWMLEHYGPRILDRKPENISARVDIFLKDCALVDDTAENTGFQGEMTKAARTVLERAVALGLAAQDASSVIEAYRNR